MSERSSHLVYISLATTLLAAGLAAPLPAAVPAGFTDTLVASVASPTAIAFTPDGRLLVTTQGGTLRVFQGGALLATPALNLASPVDRICTESERGLLGVAVDPAFATTSHVFLFYTFQKPAGAGGGCVNRVSRFTLPAGNVIDPATELVLVDEMPSPAGNHNAGDLHFGKDGHLYVSIGDGGCDWANDSGCAGANDAARDQYVLTGKVLRITKAGGIPADNPFQGAGTARCNVTGRTTAGLRCQETFAWGLRNPFRLAFDPNTAGTTTRFFVNDVGQGAWEEIDLGQAGADYGWNCREGAHVNNTGGPCSPTPPAMVDPVFEYQHGVTIPGTTSPTNCNSITGGAFVPNGLWPGFDGVYLFADFACGEIFRLSPAGPGGAAADFASALGPVVHLLFGPHGGRQALYYTTFAGGGQVRRIDFAPPQDFFTVAPCRALDTRQAGDGPALAAGARRTVTLAGECGVPATAAAVAINVTVVGPSGAGHLELQPSGSIEAGASTINFGPGQTRANNAVVALGTGGAVGVTVVGTGGSVHLLIDVVGYFD